MSFMDKFSPEQSFGTPMEAMVRRVTEVETGIYELASLVSRQGGFEPYNQNEPTVPMSAEVANHVAQSMPNETVSTPERMETTPRVAESSPAVPEMPIAAEAATAPELPVAPEVSSVPKAKASVVRSQEEIDQLNKLKDESYRLLAEALGGVKLDEIEQQFAANDPDNSKRELESV